MYSLTLNTQVGTVISILKMRTWAHCVGNLPDSMEPVRNLDRSDVRHESEKVDRVIII